MGKKGHEKRGEKKNSKASDFEDAIKRDKNCGMTDGDCGKKKMLAKMNWGRFGGFLGNLKEFCVEKGIKKWSICSRP